MKNQTEITSFWLAADSVSALINSIVWMIVSPSEIKIISQRNLWSPDCGTLNEYFLLFDLSFPHAYQDKNVIKFI